MDVLPIVGGGVCRVDAERLDGVDQLQHALDLGPASEPQQDVAAWPDVRYGRAGSPGRDRPDDVDARDHRAVVVRHPAHERECVVRRERKNAPVPIEDLLLGSMTKANPVFDAFFQPQQFDMCEVAHSAAPPLEECRAVRLALLRPAVQLSSTLILSCRTDP